MMLLRFIKHFWYWGLLIGSRLLSSMVFRLRAYGRENIPKEGGFLLLSNHQSFLDPIVCSVPLERECCFAARDTLFTSLRGAFIASINAIPIKRGSADLAAIKKFIAKLKEGYGLVLFPEATRTTDGRIADIKPGFGLLSKRSNTPVIPVVIDGAYECWPKGKCFFKMGKIVIYYGKPISPEKIKELGDEKFVESLVTTMRQMQNELRLMQGKEIYKY